MEFTGYPSYLLYLVLIAGLVLAIIRPYWAFLLSIILFSMLHTYAATYTRTSVFGPYLNLYDALFLIGMASLAFDRAKKNYIIPSPVMLIFIVLAIGILVTAFSFHINYFVTRAIRWSLTFPLAFLIAANMVTDESRAKSFLYAIIVGSVLGSLNSFVEYNSKYMLDQGIEAVRLSTAQRGLGLSLLIAATQTSFFKDRKFIVKLLWGGALILFAGCFLFGQWRAVFVAIIISMLILPLLLGNLANYLRSATLIVAVLGFTLLVLTIAFPKTETGSFFERFSYSVGPSLKQTDVGRYVAIQRELGEWYKGNLLLGRGLSYNAFLKDGLDHSIAWGHVGYVSYLPQLGLLGFFVYGIFLPFKVFFASKRLYSTSVAWAPHILGLLGVVTVVLQSIVSLMSSSYLSSTTHSIGFLFGAVWALVYGRNQSYQEK